MDGGQCSLPHPGRFTPGDRATGLGGLEGRFGHFGKDVCGCVCRNSNPDCSVARPSYYIPSKSVSWRKLGEIRS